MMFSGRRGAAPFVSPLLRPALVPSWPSVGGTPARPGCPRTGDHAGRGVTGCGPRRPRKPIASGTTARGNNRGGQSPPPFERLRSPLALGYHRPMNLEEAVQPRR